MTGSSRVAAALFPLVLLAAGAGAQGTVWVVDSAGGAGAHFALLDDAIAAAADGDVLLVRPGHYSTWSTIEGRSLVIVGDGPFVRVDGTLTVRGLAAGQRVVLRRLEIELPGQVKALDCDGVLWIEECSVLADQFGGSDGRGAVYAEDARLVVQRSALVGSMNYAIHGAPATPGLEIHGSVAAISESFVWGGDGTDPYDPGAPGATGLRVSGSSVLLEGTTISGGLGVLHPGGTGIVATSGSSVVLRDSSHAGGGGSPPGAPQEVDATSQVATAAGAAHGLASAPAATREGGTLKLTATGATGDGVALLVGTAPLALPLPFGASTLLVDPSPPAFTILLGFVPAGGSLAADFPVPSLGALPSALHFVQDVYLDAALGAVRFGPGTAPLLVDAAL